jgi:hypothetical protein
MHGFLKATTKRPRRIRQSSKRHFRNNQRAAAVRACTGACLHLGIPTVPSSVSEAAIMTGSSQVYVAALVVLIRSEDGPLLRKVMRGDIPILRAAATVRARSELVDAFRKASLADRVALVKTVGAEKVFDEMIGPALDASPPADETLARWRAMQDEAV